MGVASRQLVIRWQATTGTAKLPDIATVVTADAAQPDEAKPNEQAYSVPADQPRRIMLDQIQGSGLIQRVGLTDSHALAAPTNIHFAGWYTDSVKPGDAGLSVIDGHVSGKYRDAIFKRLKDLRTGDTFGVEYGDASVRTFTVVAVSTVPEKDAAALLFTKHDDIAKQLNVITCGGAFTAATQRFADRTIVVARAQ